ncbi:MAG: sugar ABC transporter ATP-binding protein [Candidatus Pelethousia sp.]|nr:sugar ABC transporter ATP-binding protein [Candidatus Pelethousia sp.]
MAQPILQLNKISKSFFGVQVLHDISLDLMEGEVLGLVGENGAGKSTMMNIIGGVFQPDSGEMKLNGSAYVPLNPQMAVQAGIAFIHQELSLFSNLSIAENIYIDGYPKGPLGSINKKKMYAETKAYLEKYHVDVKGPGVKVDTLQMGTRQMIEIIKALVKDTKILIFDEPTTSLSTREKKILFATIQELKENGYSVIYISHILEDVLSLSDRICVLRDGCVVGTDATANWGKESLIKSMVGRDMKQVYPTIDKKIGERVLYSIKNISCAGFVKDVSIDLHEGEIVGMFGLMGAGRSEVARAAFGVDPLEGGSVNINGVEFTRPTPSACIKNGMAFITENRREEGLLMPKTVSENTPVVMQRNLKKKFGIIDAKRESALTAETIAKMGIKTTDPKVQAVNSLSGGNQQKVVVGKWVVTDPKVFIVDEPTRGIDVGAKYEIYKLLLRLAADGAAILFISSEMEELMGMCDRILVMRDGRISGSVIKAEFSQETLGRLAL